MIAIMNTKEPIHGSWNCTWLMKTSYSMAIRRIFTLERGFLCGVALLSFDKVYHVPNGVNVLFIC